MREATSVEDFEEILAGAGFGKLPPDDLDLMKQYYDAACGLARSLREAIALDVEPATVFQAAPPWARPPRR